MQSVVNKNHVQVSYTTLGKSIQKHLHKMHNFPEIQIKENDFKKKKNRIPEKKQPLKLESVILTIYLPLRYHTQAVL